MPQTPLREGLYLHDILLWIPDNQFAYSIVAVPVSNATGATRTIEEVIGTPVVYNGTVAALVLAANAANVNAIVVGVTDGAASKFTIENAKSTDSLYVVLVRGPALINASKVSAKDPAGTDYVQATVLGGLADEGIRYQSEPAAAHTSVMEGA